MCQPWPTGPESPGAACRGRAGSSILGEKGRCEGRGFVWEWLAVPQEVKGWAAVTYGSPLVVGGQWSAEDRGTDSQVPRQDRGGDRFRAEVGFPLT